MSSAASTSPPSPWGSNQKGAPSVASVCELLRTGKARNIVVLAGAGISTSSGIPDFRSPETGLYANLEKYSLPYPEAIFDINYFQRKPEAFFALSKELYPGNFQPTLTHTFLTLLDRKKQLLRVFTQNIDTLERLAGLPADRIVEAHGSFATARCISCQKEADHDWMRQQCLAGRVARCREPRCPGRSHGKGCKREKDDGKEGNGGGGLVKPDIVFFGEGLPHRFFAQLIDLKKADLLLIMGTSLQVQPFASLIDHVSAECPRVLLNLERVGEIAGLLSGGSAHPSLLNETGFDFEGWTLPKKHQHEKEMIRDLFMQQKTDEGVQMLAEGAGWGEDLQVLYRKICKHPCIDEIGVSVDNLEGQARTKKQVDGSVDATPESARKDEEEDKKSLEEARRAANDEEKGIIGGEELALQLDKLDVKD